MIKDSLKIKTNVLIELFGPDGTLKTVRKVHNTVTSAGLAGISDQMLASPSLVKMGWMEVGTGTGGTTKLNAYIAGSKVAFTSKTRDTATITVVGDFAAGVGTGNITEAGTFDAVTENAVNMWMYATFTAIPKLAGDTLKITWTLAFADDGV